MVCRWLALARQLAHCGQELLLLGRLISSLIFFAGLLIGSHTVFIIYWSETGLRGVFDSFRSGLVYWSVKVVCEPL